MSRKRSAQELGRGKYAQDRVAKGHAGGNPFPRESKKIKLIITPRADWHATEVAEIPKKTSSSTTPAHVVDKLQKYASTLLETENKNYATINDTKSSSQRFASTIMSAGTLEDKISALTLLVQESPLHGMKPLENLMGLAGKRSRNQALMAVAAVKDLLNQGSVLPDRKLRAFSKQLDLLAASQGMAASWQPGTPLPHGLTDAHLIMWSYEDWLKKQYFEFLKILESWSSDEVDYARSRAVTYIYELLKDKPEQEDNLLRLLVHKLGDTDRKIASRTSYLLLQLQIAHPAMKTVILDAIENECLFRPGQSMHAKYYAIITLNQTILGKGDQRIASNLLRVYFSMFLQLLNPATLRKNSIKTVMKQQGGGGKPGKAAAKKLKAKEQATTSDIELGEKMTAAVLTGVNRAFPFADTGSVDFAEQIDTIFRVTHSSNFNTSIQALSLLQKLTARKHHGVDRYYRTLYESLLDPRLRSSSKQIMFLNLLYKSLKSDLNIKRVQAFVKRLLQTMNMHDVPFTCGVLYLIGELQSTFPSLRQMIREPEVKDEDEDEHFVDAPDEDAPGMGGGPTDPRRLTHKSDYDPRKRDPEHSNAERSALWDLLPLIAHYHPSVSLFAECLLLSTKMPPKPDPGSHSLMHFLDRFIYRNAKVKEHTVRGSSIMQPLAGSAAADILIKSGHASRELQPLNSQGFWSKDIQDVPADQVFFHTYFNQTNKGKLTSNKAKKKKKAVANQDDGSDENDESGEDEIWKALVKSRPEIDADDDDDDNLSMGDLESYSDDEDDRSAGDVDHGVQLADFPDDDGDVEIADYPEEDEEGDEVVADEDSDGEDLGFDDEDAQVGDDADIPSDLDVPPESGSREEGAIQENNDRRKKRRKLKHLPTFASAEDYAKLLTDEPDDY